MSIKSKYFEVAHLFTCLSEVIGDNFGKVGVYFMTKKKRRWKDFRKMNYERLPWTYSCI